MPLLRLYSPYTRLEHKRSHTTIPANKAQEVHQAHGQVEVDEDFGGHRVRVASETKLLLRLGLEIGVASVPVLGYPQSCSFGLSHRGVYSAFRQHLHVANRVRASGEL